MTMANNQHYLQQVAAMRQQKRQEEWRTDFNQAIYGREEALRNRMEIERQAAVEADPEVRAQLRDDWHYHDAQVQSCEAEIAKLRGPPPPDPRAVQYLQQRKPFFDKYGQQAAQAVDLAHQHLTRPGNAGWKVNSPEYFRALDTLLQMYAPNYGMRFDPNSDIMPTPNDAAEMSNLTPREYNEQVRKLQVLKASGNY
jgi:hypothetical protein